MILGVLDVETTGLNPLEDRLLELGLLLYRVGSLTQSNGLIAVHHLVFHYDGDRTKLTPVVAEMHSKNNLFVECCFSQAEPCDEDVLLAAQLPEGLVPAGRNVHFDLAFLASCMPLTAKRFSHRHLDLTTVDYLRGRTPRPASTHRALHDAMAELLELTAKPTLGRSVVEELG
jgi:oligoribonuclease (3'-5' exoribonuclease)